jgi:hypothetical protein
MEWILREGEIRGVSGFGKVFDQHGARVDGMRAIGFAET